MESPALIKALLINAAYEGAIAVCAPMNQEADGTPIKIDPLIPALQFPRCRARNSAQPRRPRLRQANQAVKPTDGCPWACPENPCP